MDRRDFLKTAGLPVVLGGLASEVQAEGYRRCDQVHERILPEEIDHFTLELQTPPQVVLRDLTGPNAVVPQPAIGTVEQGTAPEWFWREGAGQTIPEKSRWGEQAPGRPQDIYRAEGAVTQFGEIDTVDFVTEVIPGWYTHLLGYATAPAGGGKTIPSVPGPTVLAKLGHPIVLRVRNQIDPALGLRVSVHQHGGHTPAHSDGHPNFENLSAEGGRPAEARDYFYPNPIPHLVEGSLGEWQPQEGWDDGEVQTTMWYHDHAEDITAHNALMGLAGFFLLSDPVVDGLIQQGVLPDAEHQIPLAFRDACFCRITDPDKINPKVAAKICQERTRDPRKKIYGEASIHFDPFDHNGTLGNIMLVNGVPYPKKEVEPRPYWLRMLNASLARFFDLEFWVVHPVTREPKQLTFLRFGRDSWLFEHARPQTSVFLGMANRGDVYLDFSQFVDATSGALLKEWEAYKHTDPDTGAESVHVYVVSKLNQKDGRGPGHGDNIVTATEFPRGNAGAIPREGEGPLFLMRFEVQLGTTASKPIVKLTPDQPLRPEKTIQLPPPGKIVVRELNFERGKGAWQINKRFYDPCIANAVPELWSTELWILRNRSGGWWHPIHMHLESHQQLFVRARNHLGQRISLAREGYNPKDYEPTLEEFDREAEQNLWLETFGEGWNGAAKPIVGADARKAFAAGFDSTVWDLGIKHDTTLLGPNTEVHVLMRFRTFQGPFVFHCHNLNHEDMRMMFQMDPRSAGSDPAPPDTNLLVRPDFWFFHTDHPHCCPKSKKVQA